MNTSRPLLIATLAVLPLAPLAGCESKAPTPPAPAAAPATPAKPAAGMGDKPSDGHSHAHHGPAIDLGTTSIGPYQVKATRDEGAIAAGGDAPVDVTVTPAPGTSAKAVAVRLWIGVQSAKGSVKAKASVEDAKSPDRWHTHVEIPSPLPEGSKLWIEIEDDKGGKHVGSVDLKA